MVRANNRPGDHQFSSRPVTQLMWRLFTDETIGNNAANHVLDDRGALWVDYLS
jgi:hypothetical protein